MLSDHLASLFSLGRSTREVLQPNQTATPGRGRYDHIVENLQSQASSKRAMRGSTMPQVPPAHASAHKPSKSVSRVMQIRIASLLIMHNNQVALARTINKKFCLLCCIIPYKRTALCMACRAAGQMGLHTNRNRMSREEFLEEQVQEQQQGECPSKSRLTDPWSS